SMGTLLSSLLVSYVAFGGTSSESFASWLYLPMCGLSLVTPFLDPDRLDPSDSSEERLEETGDNGLLKLVSLIIFSIMAPALIPRIAPRLSTASMWLPSALLLGGSMVSSGLFLTAALCRLDSAISTGVSCEQTTIAMNCPPAQLWTAIGRDFQSAWEHGVPNR